MSKLVENEVQLFKSILQQQIGFKFPLTLERQFEYQLQEALKATRQTLRELLNKLQGESNPTSLLQILAPLLPLLLIGETYFWREPQALEALAQHILPEIQSRRATFNHTLRVWSAGCSTGEEIYSLAIFLRNHFRNSDWQVSLLGTDINELSLEKARAAVYGANSFRGPYERYPEAFEKIGSTGGRRVLSEYRSGVHFQKLNLASDDYPSSNNFTSGYDLIFCRNIFIYFDPELTQQVVNRFYEALNYGGYLVVSPCEYSQIYSSRLKAISTGQLTFFQRPLLTQNIEKVEIPAVLPDLEQISTVVTYNTPAKLPISQKDLLIQAHSACQRNDTAHSIKLYQQLVKSYPLHSESYLMLTALYQEAGQIETALEMVRRFAYLEPERAEGQFYLGHLETRLGNTRRATLAYRRLLKLLENSDPGTNLKYLPALSCDELCQIAQQNIGAISKFNN